MDLTAEKDTISRIHKSEYETQPGLIVNVPGIIRFLGEYTETMDGCFLAFPASWSLSLAISIRTDASFRFYHADLNERKRTTSANLRYKREDRWANLIKGTVSKLIEKGFSLYGCNFSISSNIPPYSGLNSSSALALATVFALKESFDLALTEMEILEIVIAVEFECFQKAGSELEIKAVLLAKTDRCVYIDARNGDSHSIPFHFDPWRLVITNSNVPFSSSVHEVKKRLNDCQRCLEYLADTKHKKSLRNFNQDDFVEYMGLLPETTRRRGLFIVEEIRRTHEAEEALRKHDFLAFGKILHKSQDSLRDLFEVTCPEIDWLVKRAEEIDGILASRMVGSGFGGATLSLIKQESMEKYRGRLEEYERIFGFKAEYSEIETREGVLIL